MTTPTTLPSSFAPRPKRSRFGVGSALVLLAAMAVPFGGCLLADVGTGPDCAEGVVIDTSEQDCVRQVCKSEALVDEGDDTEFPDDGNPCTSDFCVGGKATHTATAGGCRLGQSVGVCKGGECVVWCSAESQNCDDDNPCTKNDCDLAAGQCAFSPDDGVVPDDQNDCTDDSCVGGKEMHLSSGTGTPCGADGMGRCNGEGACVGCVTDKDCPPDEDCKDWACTNETCTPTNRSDGTSLPDDKQIVGDCKNVVCDGAGGVTDVPNEGDVPANNGNECMDPRCSRGTPVFSDKSPGEACSSGVCNGAGACVECLDTADCDRGFNCDMNECISCSDGKKNGTETDTDCGGGACEDCTDGSTCEIDEDCTSNACYDGVCCDNVCDGTCQACNQPGKEGQCLPLPKFKDDTMPVCSGDMTCNGGGSCKADNDQPCSKNSECASNNCVKNGDKTCQP
jgi:hypothetical protein